MGEATDLRAGRFRFLRPETEAAYRAWHARQAMPFMRLTYGVTLAIVFPAALLATWIVAPAAFLSVMAWVLLVLTPIMAGGLAGTYRAWMVRWMGVASVFSHIVSASSFVVIAFYVLHRTDIAIASVIIGVFIAFTTLRLHPGEAAASALPYYVIAGVLMLRLDPANAAPYACLAFIALAIGLVVARTIDRTSRLAFRQETIIEEQKRTIAEERARSEMLLKNELSHQVAERSRELGDVLAKSATTEARAPTPGDRFAARYRIVQLLGSGGMGSVYEVERITDNQRLALKIVTGQVTPAHAARFAREAEIGARVRHENVVSIVDVGIAEGAPFLAMELVAGKTLEDERARFGDPSWGLPILAQIATGLGVLHGAGVVHRDLKPGNVLLTADAAVAKISDFGISRFGAGEANVEAATMDAGASPPALTGTNAWLGTPLYMAPEAARGARAMDTPADVFAFGIVAYEVLTGRKPHEMPAILLAMAGKEIPAPPSFDDARVPDAVERLVRACLDPSPDRRPRMRDVIAGLRS